MTEKEFKKAYREYLLATGRVSANSYVSYINKACQLPGMHDLWDKLAEHDGDQRWQVTHASKLVDTIICAKNDPGCPLKRKELDNGLSAARALLAFVSMRSVPKTAVLPTGGVVKTDSDLIVYENSVPTCEQIPGLRAFLADEYKKIRDFAQDILKNIWQDFPIIPVYLSEKTPQKTYYYSREFLLEKLSQHCARCKEKSCPAPCRAIAGILEEYAPFTQNIYGEFYAGKEPHIVLYFKNFANPSMHNPDFLAQIANTLAHEYLHYLEFAYRNSSKVTPTELESVSEALADFFGLMYSLQRAGKEDLLVAKKEYNGWKRHWGSSWPYAYAICFYRVNGYVVSYTSQLDDYARQGIIQKFRDVFVKTNDHCKAETRLISMY